MAANRNDDFRFRIVHHFGVLSTSATGWSKELNMVEWNGKAAKYDIRDWHPNHGKMGRGITLSKDEMKELVELIDSGCVEGIPAGGAVNGFSPLAERGTGSGLYDDLTA